MRGKIVNGVLYTGYEPHAGQIELHQCEARFRICVCGRRWGKTTGALNDLFKQAWLNNDKLARVWYVAPSYRQAKTVAWEMIKEIIPEQVISSTNESELSIRLVNNTLCELKGADSQDSLRGAKLKFVVLDEYASMRATAWDEVIRPAMADVPNSKALFIGTPSGFNHFKVLFDKGNSGDKEFKSFRFRTIDNPYISPREIEEIRKKTNPIIFRQEYEASFEQMAGSIYPMFKRDEHVVRPFAIPDDWDRIVGLDWGYRNPTGVVFAAIDYEGNIYCYDSWKDSGLTVSQWANRLKTREDFPMINNFLIDPSALAQAKEFGQYGIYFTSYNPETMKRINDVNIGINLVSQNLLEKKIKIFETCMDLIVEVEQYQWEQGRSRLDIDPRPKPLKKDDHLCDALRYIIMARPLGNRLTKDRYKGLDSRSEIFWREHYNDIPKEAEWLYPKDPMMFGLDEEYSSLSLEDLC